MEGSPPQSNSNTGTLTKEVATTPGSTGLDTGMGTSKGDDTEPGDSETTPEDTKPSQGTTSVEATPQIICDDFGCYVSGSGSGSVPQDSKSENINLNPNRGPEF